jgi:GDPmannose 4,6-dehydratase
LRLGNLATVRDWGWAPEYVEAMARMLKLDEPRDFIIATGQSHTLGELVDAIFSAAGLCWRDHVDAETVPPRPSACLAQHADPSLARDLLGWEARVDLPSLAERLVREKLD